MEQRNLLTEIKAAVTVLGAGLTAWLGTLAVPVYLLVALNIADYLTGFVAAPYRGDRRSSQKGYRGIAKKISMWILVGVGAALDGLLAYTANTMGIGLTLGSPVGAAVAVWLICNEIVSILENIGDIGVKLPGFLTRLAQWIAAETEQRADPEKGLVIKDGTKIDSAHGKLSDERRLQK